MTHTSLALLVQHVTPVGGPSGPSAGGDSQLVSATLYLAVAAIALIAGPALTGAAATVWSRRLRDLAAGTAGIVGGVAVLRAPSALADVFGGPASHAVLLALHLAVVCVWLGGVLHLAVVGVASGAEVTRRAIARFTPLAIAASAVIAGSGAVLMIGDRVGLQALLHSALGALIIVKIVAVALAAMVGAGHRLTPSVRERRTLLRTEAGVLAAALGVGSALVAMPLPAAAVTAVTTGISTISMGAAGPVALFAVQTPVGVRVLLLSDEPVALDDETHRVQLTPGRSTPVSTADGRVRLSITSGEVTRTVSLRRAQVAVPVSPLLSDVDAQVAFALGRALAHSAAPATICLPDPAALATATSRLLGPSTKQRVQIDGTPSSAIGRLHALSTRGGVAAVSLTPRLLEGSVLSAIARLRLPPVTVAGVGDPTSTVADRYRADLALLGSGVAPSLAGLLGYESAVAPAMTGRVALYAAEPIGFLPGVVDAGHTHPHSQWVPGGSLVAITPVTSIPITCSDTEET